MLKNYLKDDLIFINPAVDDKKKLFLFIAGILTKKGLITKKNRFFNSLMEREELGNTELARNTAIPHVHCSSVKKLFISIIISKTGIDYGHPDNGPAKIIYLIGCPSGNNKEYLQLLANVARMIKTPDLTNRMIECTSVKDVLNLLKAHDLYDGKFSEIDNSLLIITLYKVDWLNSVLSALVELGIGSASIITSTSLAKRLTYDIPVFAGLKLKGLTKDAETAIVFTNIPDTNLSGQLCSLLKDEGLDFEEPGNGYMQLFKVKEIIGHSDEFI